MRDGQVPLAPFAIAAKPHGGVVHAPPSCGRATTPSPNTSGVWRGWPNVRAAARHVRMVGTAVDDVVGLGVVAAKGEGAAAAVTTASTRSPTEASETSHAASVATAIAEELVEVYMNRATANSSAVGVVDHGDGAVRELIEAVVQKAVDRGEQLRVVAAAAAAAVRAPSSRIQRGRIGAGPRSRGPRGDQLTSIPSTSICSESLVTPIPGPQPIEASVNTARTSTVEGVLRDTDGGRTVIQDGALAMREIGGVDEGGGAGVAADGATLVAGFGSPATASMALSVLAVLPTAPSRTTIAPPARWPLAILAMCAIARRG